MSNNGKLEMTPSVRVAPKPKRLLGMRHVQVALTFFGAILACLTNVNLSIVIIAMVDKEGANPDFPEYDWNEKTQSVVLSGFTWGYFLLQLPGGLIAERFGPCLITTVAMITTSVFAILTPLAASTGGWQLVFACRFVQGLAQGVLFPVTQVLLARWIPEEERSTLSTLHFSGSELGVVLTLAASGWLSVSSWGWPSVFYVFGGLAISWTVLWMLFGANSPAEDRFISAEERAYIENSLRTNEQGAKPVATPWRAIFTSRPVWAIIVACCGFNWGFWILLTEMPNFMKTVLGFDLEANGVLSALPYLFKGIVSIIFGVASDWLGNRKIVSVKCLRKFSNSIAFFVPCIALIILPYSRDTTLSVALLMLAISSDGGSITGFAVNTIDVAPNFAGTIYGAANALGSLVGCFAPISVGLIVTDVGSVPQWTTVFFIAAGVYFFTGIYYAVYAEVEVQPWNDPPTSTEVELALLQPRQSGTISVPDSAT